MSETPPTGHPPAPGPVGFPPGLPPPGPWGPPGPMPVNRPARWPTFVMLVITLVAVGAAIAAWLRPIPHETSTKPAAPTYSEQQVADAKSKVCAAFEKVHSVIQLNSTRAGGEDANSQLLVAVNARQILMTGSAYLLTVLSDEPATPQDLAAPINKVARLYQTVTLDGLASDLSIPKQNEANATGSQIESLCK
jgi:hypothetical protein